MYRIKNEIEALNCGKEGEYGKDFMNLKFDADDRLSLNKPLKFPTMTIIVRSVFNEDSNFFPQIYLDEYLYKL